MTRVIHTGDTHIGYRQYNAPERRQDFLDAFDQVATDAIDEGVDALVHAGDLFHDRRPGLRDLQGTVEILRRLAAADVPVLAVVGNHESKRDGQWLDLFADLGLATRLGPDPTVVGDVAFYGLDFVPRSRRDDLEYAFAPRPPEAEYAVLVSHGLFEPFDFADWDTERVLAESSVQFDAVLLGDNHTPDTAVVADTWVTYCGSTERASASERDDRGYNIVSFEDEVGQGPDADGAPSDVAMSRRTLPDTRDFVFVDVDLDPGEGIDRVLDRVREYDLADAVVIVTIEGAGDPITPASIEEFATERGALVARVNDRREIDETDDEVRVSFADPDDAVRERIREMGLSDGTLSIDQTVRDRNLADANVRETVERRVRDLLESDPDAFEPAPDCDLDEATTVATYLEERNAGSDADEKSDTDSDTDEDQDGGSDTDEDRDTDADAGKNSGVDSDGDEHRDADSNGDAQTGETATGRTDESPSGPADNEQTTDGSSGHASLGDFT